MDFKEFKAAYMKEVQEKNVRRVVHPIHKNIVVLKYTDRCKWGRKWNSVNMVCRNLIVDEENEQVIGRGFKKFFSQRQREDFSTEYLNENFPFHRIEVTEKYDGIEAVSYKVGDDIFFASEGSFTIASTKITQKIWDENYKQAANLVPENVTLIVETIHPDLRVVIPYQFEDLILVGATNYVTQHDYNYEELKALGNVLGMKVMDKFEFTVEEAKAVVENSDFDFEGFVIRYANNERIKIKGEKYVQVFKALQMENAQKLSLWEKGKLDALIESLPEMYKEKFVIFKVDLDEKREQVKKSVNSAFEEAPKTTKKDFAIWVNANVKEEFRRLMFDAFDNKSNEEALRRAVVKSVEE